MKIKYTYPRDYFGNHTILELNAEYVTFSFQDKECSLKDVFTLMGEMEARIKKLEESKNLSFVDGILRGNDRIET